MRLTATAVGIFALIVVVLVAIWGIGFGFRWFIAEPQGQLEAREDILSGQNRIAAYEHFFNLCVSVQGAEAQLDALYEELKSYDPGTKDYARTRTNITGVTAQRQRSIYQYNADANKDYTVGQFRDLDLPYQLDPAPYQEGVRTTC